MPSNREIEGATAGLAPWAARLPRGAGPRRRDGFATSEAPRHSRDGGFRQACRVHGQEPASVGIDVPYHGGQTQTGVDWGRIATALRGHRGGDEFPVLRLLPEDPDAV